MKIAVIGCGTVGIMSTCHFLYYLPESSVDCIYDINKKILGIGESTNLQLPDLLYKSANFNSYLDNKDLDLTLKHGVLYKNWRTKEFLSPIIPPSYAFHFNNFKLKDVIFNKLKNIYKNRFKEIHSEVKVLSNTLTKVELLVNNKLKIYDYVIDCRGYPEDYSDYNESNFLPLNHALVYMIKEPGRWEFTYHQATKNGWMFGIPLQTRQGWGYLFNDRITSVEKAKKDIADIFKIKNLNEVKFNEFKFKPYHAKKFLDKRILKNGNQAIFYEPIEALSGVFYDNINRAFIDFILKIRTENEVNSHLLNMAKKYENFIAFVYHGGSTFKSDFWDDTITKTKNHLKNNKEWEETIKFINNKKNYEFSLGNSFEAFPFCIKLYKQLSNNLNYKYFN
jgi:hypothetical protein